MRRLTIAQAVLAAYPRPLPRPVMPQRLARAEVLACEITHLDTFNLLAFGKPTVQTMWDWCANVLMWSRAADLLDLGQDEMKAQLEGLGPLVERWLRAGRVGFDGPGLRLARHGVDLMDELARQVDQGTAHEAAVWAEARLAEMRIDSPNTERIAA